MPSDINQLTAGRQVTGLRQVLDCPATPAVLRQGPAAAPGEAPDWLALLCPAHSEALPGWPGTAADTAGLSLSCGSVLDYRSAEQLLQSHADRWLTPLTGVDPKTYAGVWPDVLDQADRVMRARLGEDAADGDETLHSLAMMLGMASRNAAEGNLYQATVLLAYCKTLAQRL
ncbi:hypothetical protein ACGFWE_43075 [Streptomyces sp. NPDC048523]|uniref:hypothetical protein n=1 Tax=Streptomyces sp. NPDC048523 TaxID=3365567 RepID=UPI0037206252